MFAERKGKKNPTCQAARRREAARYMLMSIILLCSFVFPTPSNGTLIMFMRHKNEIYMASDGVAFASAEELALKHVKCFPTCDGGCVALAGYSGGQYTFSRMLKNLQIY
jgi:hypothetical protein